LTPPDFDDIKNEYEALKKAANRYAISNGEEGYP
jgi:hypothetical protein